jgi:maltose/moltooligosaccharide transporter
VISKPHLSAWQIAKVCVGAFGIQFGFALPQANLTRIFQSLGASLDHVPLLWLAGPITGLIVQPLVGFYSDRTWTRFGRRRPYFLIGAALAAVALVAMPNATTLWMAALLLWLLDASLNLTMGPFRAFVADQLSAEQRPRGYLLYMFFASAGAVIGSLLPWVFARFGFHVSAEGGINDAVRYAFYVGAALLFSAVCWSAFTNREYTPEMLVKFDDTPHDVVTARTSASMRKHALVWVVVGAVALLAASLANVRAALYVLVFAALAYGLFLFTASRLKRDTAFVAILSDIDSMSSSMRRLALVQFFSWFTLFAFYVYATPALAKMHFGAGAPGTPGYEAAANWVDVLFSVYNGIALVAAMIIPHFVRKYGSRRAHQVNLWMGAAGLGSMLLIRDPQWLLVSMIGFGFAWGSIISLPYAMLANNLPPGKMGVNFGVFNIFIVIPQLLAAGLLPTLLAGDPVYALGIGAAGWFLAGLAVLRVPDTAAREIKPTL